MRGYLWQNLHGEIAEEFEELSELPDFTRLRFYLIDQKDHNLRRAFEEDAERERVDALLRQHGTSMVRLTADARARARGRDVPFAKPTHPTPAPKPEGACSKKGCRRPHAPGVKLCEYHRALANAAVSRHGKRKRGMREKLEDIREGITHHFTVIALVNGQLEEIDGYIQTGCYADGRLGEIFIRIGKPGDQFAMLDQWAIAFSIALQYGAKLEDLCRKFIGARFEPSGATRNPDIPRCTSLVDYATRWLLQKYGKSEEVQSE